MMFADTVQLEVLAIQPETSLDVKLEIAETCRGLDFINDLTVSYELCTHLIYIWVIARPFVKVSG